MSVNISAKLPPSEAYPEGEKIKRKYTPTSKITQKGTFDLLIKIYRKGEYPNCPEGGKMTQYIDALNIGDKIIISGPTGKFNYKGKGLVYKKKLDVEGSYKELGLIAGGTGIAPMFQIMQAIHEDKSDTTKVHLLFANRTQFDILMQDELEEFKEDERFKIYYAVDKAKPTWKGFIGWINKDMITQTMPKPTKDVLICTCGRSQMTKLAKGVLLELGYDASSMFKF